MLQRINCEKREIRVTGKVCPCISWSAAATTILQNYVIWRVRRSNSVELCKVGDNTEMSKHLRSKAGRSIVRATLQIAYRTAICSRERLSYNQFSLYCCPTSSFCYKHNVEVCPGENLSYIQFSLYCCPITSCPISDPQCIQTGWP